MAKKQENLGEFLTESLNKKFKKTLGQNQTVYFLDGNGESPNNITDWVSTGVTHLDMAISNRVGGGLPVGRIVELMGLEQSGKSLLAGHITANTQKKGGIVVYIDTEMSLDSRFLRAIGVDVSKMLYVPLQTIEDIFEAMEDIIIKIREKDKDRLVTIIVDSVAGATTKMEEAADYSRDGYSTAKAILMGKSMRKLTNLIGKQKILCVFTNQLRDKMNAMAFGEKYTTPGGKALQFHCSVRLKLQNIGRLKGKVNGVDEIIGQQVQVTVVKNRLGPPNRKVKYSVYYDSGIDDADSLLKVLKEYKIVKASGPVSKCVNIETGEEHTFYARDFKALLEKDPELKAQLLKQLSENYIMLYSHEVAIERDPDEIEVDTKDE